MKRKLLSMLLAAVLMLSLAACGTQNQHASSDTETTNQPEQIEQSNENPDTQNEESANNEQDETDNEEKNLIVLFGSGVTDHKVSGDNDQN